MTTVPKRRSLACACCAGSAGKWLQWWNQDTGFGLCARCADWQRGRVNANPKEKNEDPAKTAAIRSRLVIGARLVATTFASVEASKGTTKKAA